MKGNGQMDAVVEESREERIMGSEMVDHWTWEEMFEQSLSNIPGESYQKEVRPSWWKPRMDFGFVWWNTVDVNYRESSWEGIWMDIASTISLCGAAWDRWMRWNQILVVGLQQTDLIGRICSVAYCAVTLLETLIHMVIRDDTIHTLGARYIKLVYVYALGFLGNSQAFI